MAMEKAMTWLVVVCPSCKHPRGVRVNRWAGGKKLCKRCTTKEAWKKRRANEKT